MFQYFKGNQEILIKVQHVSDRAGGRGDVAPGAARRAQQSDTAGAVQQPAERSAVAGGELRHVPDDRRRTGRARRQWRRQRYAQSVWCPLSAVKLIHMNTPTCACVCFCFLLSVCWPKWHAPMHRQTLSPRHETHTHTHDY